MFLQPYHKKCLLKKTLIYLLQLKAFVSIIGPRNSLLSMSLGLDIGGIQQHSKNCYIRFRSLLTILLEMD